MTSVSMDMEKLKTPCIAGEDVKWCTQFGNLLTLFVDLVFCNILMLTYQFQGPCTDLNIDIGLVDTGICVQREHITLWSSAQCKGSLHSKKASEEAIF